MAKHGLLIVIAAVCVCGVVLLMASPGALLTYAPSPATIAVLCALRILQVTIAGIGWWLLLGRNDTGLLVTCIVLRFVREGINTLLPAAQVGGDIVAARLLAGRLPLGTASAATLADVVLQAASLALFAGFCLALLALGGTALPDGAGTVLALLLPLSCLAVVVFATRSRGLLTWSDTLGARSTGTGLLARVGRLVSRALAAIHASGSHLTGSPGRILAALSLHVLTWFGGAAEVYALLAQSTEGAQWRSAIILEGLGQAARAGAIVVPAGIGVQEGAYVAVGALVGIAAAHAVALSIARRIPDLVIGLPSLLVWAMLEARTFRKRVPHAKDTQPIPPA